MSFFYRKIKQGPDAEWTVKDLDSITFEAVELSFENSSGTEVVNIDASGNLEVTGDLDVTGSISALGTVQVIEKNVDCSANTAGATTAIGTVPANSILINVIAYCDALFNGDTTTNASVGITGNTDKYIDPSDFDVTTKDAQLDMYGGTNNDQKYPEYLGTATPLILTHINTASASAGEVTIRVLYVPLA